MDRYFTDTERNSQHPAAVYKDSYDMKNKTGTPFPHIRFKNICQFKQEPVKAEERTESPLKLWKKRKWLV